LYTDADFIGENGDLEEVPASLKFKTGVSGPSALPCYRKHRGSLVCGGGMELGTVFFEIFNLKEENIAHTAL